MRVAVTGASGFIGAAVVRALRAAGHTVEPFGRRDIATLRSPMPGYGMWDIGRDIRPCEVDAVVHCAAAVGQWGAPDVYWRTNVHGTANVVASVPATARMVYISTASVYAVAHSDAPIPESASSVSRPLSVYGRSKLAAEHIVLTSGRPAIVLRPHIVYGPGDTTLWPRVVAARRNASIRIPGTGANAVSVTHVDNLLIAILLAVHDGAPAGIYNVADREAVTVDELLRTMFRRRNLPTSIRYVPRSLAWTAATAMEVFWKATARRGEPILTRYAVRGLADPCVLNLSRAYAQLEYQPRWTFRDGPL